MQKQGEGVPLIWTSALKKLNFNYHEIIDWNREKIMSMTTQMCVKSVVDSSKLAGA